MKSILYSLRSAQSAIAAKITAGLSRTRTLLFCELRLHPGMFDLFTQADQLLAPASVSDFSAAAAGIRAPSSPISPRSSRARRYSSRSQRCCVHRQGPSLPLKPWYSSVKDRLVDPMKRSLHFRRNHRLSPDSTKPGTVHTQHRDPVGRPSRTRLEHLHRPNARPQIPTPKLTTSLARPTRRVGSADTV